MAPLVEAFPASELPLRTQITAQGKKRKGFNGELTKCALHELVQYKCEVEEPVTRESPTICWPVVRLLRRCQNTVKGEQRTFMVETTAWEESRR